MMAGNRDRSRSRSPLGNSAGAVIKDIKWSGLAEPENPEVEAVKAAINALNKDTGERYAEYY